MSSNEEKAELGPVVVEQKIVNAAFLATDDPEGGKWVLVKPEDVPAFCKQPDTLGNLIADPLSCVQDKDVDPRWWRAVTVDHPDLKARQVQQGPAIILPSRLH